MENEIIPVMIGTLITRQGINGFQAADKGHPVFEINDRYVIYLESLTPEKISKHGEETKYSHFKVAVPYYKKTLSPYIDFQ